MSWPLVKLSEVATINPRCPKDIDGSQEVSFLAMASVSENGHLLNQEPRILEETKKGFTYFERNDVIVAKITPCFENGKAAYLDKLDTRVGFGSTEFHVLRPDTEKLDGKYLFYLLWNPKFRHLGERNMSGSAGQKRVPADLLKKHEIPLPPLPEQKRIAAILDKADQLRQKRQQAIGLADEFLRSVFLDMFGDPVTNPKGWETTTLPAHGFFKNGLNFGRNELGASVRYLGVGDFKSRESIKDMQCLGHVELNALPSDEYLLKNGDLIFVRSNGNKALVGRCLLYPLQGRR